MSARIHLHFFTAINQARALSSKHGQLQRDYLREKRQATSLKQFDLPIRFLWLTTNPAERLDREIKPAFLHIVPRRLR